MKKAYLKELQSQLLGSVSDNADVRDFFATDASLFEMTPQGVVFPFNTADVRKTVQFVAERSASGKPLSITPRGSGTDLSGAAIGDGLQLVFPTHMNKLLKIDRDTITVQPGINFRTVQQTLYTHGRHIPVFPASVDYSTVGGAVANNASGTSAVKYGGLRKLVKSLKVVLSDGSLITAHRISSRELNRKKGLSTLEGELYRKVDALILDHPELVKKHKLRTTKNSAAYAMSQVKGSDGSIDLSQLFVGAQGTLGIITEITLATEPYNPRTTLLVASFSSQDKAGEAVTKLRKLTPSALDFVNGGFIEYMRTNRPHDLEGMLPETTPKMMLFVEFDDFSQLTQKVKANRAARLLGRLTKDVRVSTDPIEQVALWKIRRSSGAILGMQSAHKPALPFVEDAAVPPAQFINFLDKTTKLLAKYDLDSAIWGHAGDGHLHFHPFMDLSKKKDVEKMMHLSNEFYDLAVSLGGTISAAHGDGLVRAGYLKLMYGEEILELYASLKHAFDPLDIFNPMKKAQATPDIARASLRDHYAMKHLYDHYLYT